MQDLKRFAKSTGVYLMGSVLTKFAAFLMLPFYTRYLRPSEYGNFDLYTAYAAFLGSILFIDIWSGVMRFMFDYKSDEARAKPVTIGVVIFSVSSIFYCASVAVLGSAMNIPHQALLMLYGLSMNAANFVGYVARAQGKNAVYVFGGLAGAAATVASSILFLAVFQKGYQSLYVSYALGHLVNVAVVGRSARISGLIDFRRIDKELLKEMLRFSAPLPLNSAAYWFLTSYNKVVISQRLSTYENGIYAVANKFGNIVSIITQCFQMAWQEMSFSKAGNTRAEMGQFYTAAVNEYLRFMWGGTLLVISLVKVIFPIIVSREYWEAENLIPLALLAAFFSCISSFVASIMSTIKENRLVFLTTNMGAILNVGLMYALVGGVGLQAANIAFGAGFLVVCVSRIFLLRKYISIRVKWHWMAGFIAATCTVCAAYFWGDRLLNGAAFVLLMGAMLLMYRKPLMKLFGTLVRRE